MNNIAEDQNAPKLLRIMKARQRIYAEATRLQIVQLICNVAMPVAGATAALLHSPARPWVAIYGLVVTMLDVLWIDRSQRGKLKLAAKLGEQFDCSLLKMPWNAFTAGRPVDAETIDGAARKFSGDEARVLNWYPDIAKSAPLSLARIICQRTNLWYDSTLRRSYGRFLAISVAAVVLALIASAFFLRLELTDFVAIAATVSPAMIWAIRERFRQIDAADSLETVKQEAEKLLAQASGGHCDEAECERRSREFQDAIFNRRASNPLILPLVYRFMRPELEQQMQAGVDALLDNPHQG